MVMSMPGVSRSFGYPNYFARLLNRGHFISIPTNAGWTTGHTGSGAATSEPSSMSFNTGLTGSSVALLQEICGFGLARGATSRTYINWAKELWFFCGFVTSETGDAQTTRRIQLKQVATEGALDAKGIGFRFDNLTLVGESYGTALASTGSFLTTANREYTLAFKLIPGVSIEWFYGTTYPLTSLGINTTAANIPSGESTDNGRLVVSITNGTTASDRDMRVFGILLWQE